MSELSSDGAGLQRLVTVTATAAIRPLGDPRQEGIDRLIRLEVGKQFQAQIVSRFYDGTHIVRIADISVRVALPGVGEVGDSLALTLLTTDPRATFSLDSLTPARAAVPGVPLGDRIAQSLSLKNTAATDHATATDYTSGTAVTAHISESGRLVADLLSRAQEGAVLTGNMPLSPAPGASAPQLASALQDTLAFSGLFYESHVSQWVNGERPQGDLLREPQARNGSTATSLGAALPATMQGELPSHVAETRRNLLEYFTSTALPNAGKAAVDAGAVQMINLQLNALEQQKVQWQGYLCPGQPLQWEVRRDNQSAQEPGAERGDQRWQSDVCFTLPSLGMISATIKLAGQRVQIQVRTQSDESAVALRGQAAKLISALEIAGSPLDNLTVKREAPSDDRT